MPIQKDIRVWEFKGFNPQSDLLTTMACTAEYDEGTILVEDASLTNRLTTSENKAEFLLLKRVDDDVIPGASLAAAAGYIFVGADPGAVGTGELVSVFSLKIGAQWWTTNFASGSETGALSSATALNAALGHVTGKICVKQTTGAVGTVEFFRLKENTIATNGAIKVRCTVVS